MATELDKKKRNEERELEGSNPASPSSGGLEEARAIAEQVEKDTGIPQGTPGYNYHKDSNGKWVATGIETQPDGDVVEKPMTVQQVLDQTADDAANMEIADGTSPWLNPSGNGIPNEMLKEDPSLRKGVQAQENPSDGLQKMSMPDVKATPLNVGAGGIKTQDGNTLSAPAKTETTDSATADTEDDGYAKTLREYRQKLMKQESDDMDELAKMKADMEKREKTAKWSKAFASIGDAVSGIAALAGTAHWGKATQQSSMTQGINSEMKEAREKYTRDVDSIRKRLDYTREGVLKSYKDEMNAKLSQQRIDIAKSREDRMMAKDALWSQFKAAEQALKQQGLDIQRERIESWIDINANKLQYMMDKMGLDSALGWARVEIQKEAEDRRAQAAADREAKAQEKEAMTKIYGDWDTMVSKAMETVLGGKSDNEMSTEERSKLAAWKKAKSNADKQKLLDEWSANADFKSYLDSRKSAGASTSNADEKSSESGDKKPSPMGGKKKNPMS